MIKLYFGPIFGDNSCFVTYISLDLELCRNTMIKFYDIMRPLMQMILTYDFCAHVILGEKGWFCLQPVSFLARNYTHEKKKYKHHLYY